MGNIYYDPPNGVSVHIPVALRQHRDKDAFLALLAGAELVAFAARLFAAETMPSAEISPVFALAKLALEHNLTDLAAEIGDLADEVGY
ncbi:MAG: hypothetical protein HQL45_06925 [Alphaproteobacteria bacterium]|nr:hypothetical protein [Alphaproteobacteria bacterium]